MSFSFKRGIAGLAILALFGAFIPLPAAAATPLAQTIFKQSFANLEKLPSYDFAGRVGIVLPEELRQEAIDPSLAFLAQGQEFRTYFTGSADQVAKTYSTAVTFYNPATGQSPLLEMVGDEAGTLNFRVSGFSLPTSTASLGFDLSKYLNTWIRIDQQTVPNAFLNPALMPLLGVQGTSAENPSYSNPLSADEAKMKEMNAKIEKAFWSRNVVTATRVADAKDASGAPAYRLRLKLNPVGARLFILDISKIIGEKPSASDIRELNKLFTKLPAFSADLIVNKRTMLPELLSFSVSSAVNKNKTDNLTVNMRMTFEHFGSGRPVVMPADYKKFETIIAELAQNRPFIQSQPTMVFTTPTMIVPPLVTSTSN